MLSDDSVAPKIARFVKTMHKSSRKGQAIDRIVVHYTTSRNIDGTIAHFRSGTPRVSAHYIVGQDGKLVQMVPDVEAAWHAGSSDMNKRSIGIEHVAAAGDRITPAQSRTSIALIRWLMWTYRIQQEHVIPHCYIKPTSCCGDLFAEFGGGANKKPAEQLVALHRWMVVNAVDLPASGLASDWELS